MSQASEGESKAHITQHLVSPISPTGGYQVHCTINGVDVSFLLDTGAAVTLLRKDTWDQANFDNKLTLLPYSTVQLVGVDGSPLTVHGRATVKLYLEGVSTTTDIVVVSPLTTEAILGLDFLQEHQARIDLPNRRVYLADQRMYLPLQSPVCAPAPRDKISVCTVERFEIPPWSEKKIMATVQQAGAQGVWLLEESNNKCCSTSVARALVQVMSDQVPVCLLNTQAEPITVYPGTEIATLQQVELPTANVRAVAGGLNRGVDKQQWQLVSSILGEVETKLSPEEHEQFLTLLCSYTDVFAASNSDLGRTSMLKHRINTGDAAPIRQPVRRLPPQQREEVQRLIREMLERGVVERSTSPWASPIVLVKKKDGTVRFCVDYRKVNNITHKDAYPLPRIDTTLDTLSGSMWFSTLDLLSGYWQVEVEETDKEKTAFCTTEGLFQFKVMPFGLCNAPAILSSG